MVEGDRLVGYLLGQTVVEQQWGRSAWIHLPCCALAPDHSMETLRELYAVLGDIWVKWGIFTHFALMPAGDQTLLNAWHSLSFGIEQTHGLLNMSMLPHKEPVLETGIELRRATPADAPILRELADILWLHLTKAPTWGMSLPEKEEERREGYANLALEENISVWLAFAEGRAVGLQTFSPEPTDTEDLLTAEHCLSLGVAATREEYRGRGISKALFYRGMQEGMAQGYRIAETDWRTTNLLANRAWLGAGFQPAAYRLTRRIDNRIAWGDGGWRE